MPLDLQVSRGKAPGRVSLSGGVKGTKSPPPEAKNMQTDFLNNNLLF